MNELGQWLREAREAKGLSLAEVEAHTRIRQKFLAALEAEEWDVLPGDVAAVGFLRKYAKFLNLDADSAAARYRTSVSRPIPIPEPLELPEEREADYRPIEMELDRPAQRRMPWRLVAVLLVLMVVAAGAAWLATFGRGWVSYYAGYLASLPILGGATATPPLVEASPTRAVIRVTATPTATPVAAPTATPTATGGGPPPATAETALTEATRPPSAPIATALRLTLQTTARAWVRVQVDGENRLESILEPGTVSEWEGREIRLRTGNAAGVQVSVNDTPRGPLGGPGEVVEYIWRLVDGQVEETTPVPAPESTPTAVPTPAP